MNFDLGKTIYEARERVGLSERQLAKLIGVSNSEISKIERNKVKNPNHKILKAICRYIDLSYNDIIFGLGLGATYNIQNKFLIKYYCLLTGDDLKNALMAINEKIKLNEDIIFNLKDLIKKNGHQNDIIDTIKSLEYENKTSYHLKQILERKVIDNFLISS